MRGEGFPWWERVRCTALRTNNDQCTREKDHDGPHYSAYSEKAWADR
jgi:hypothetical protein